MRAELSLHDETIIRMASRAAVCVHFTKLIMR